MQLHILNIFVFTLVIIKQVRAADNPPADVLDKILREADVSLRAELERLLPIRTQRMVIGTGASSSHKTTPPAPMIEPRPVRTKPVEKSNAQRKLSFDGPYQYHANSDILDLKWEGIQYW